MKTFFAFPERCFQESSRSLNRQRHILNNAQLSLVCTPTSTPTSIIRGYMELHEIVSSGNDIVSDYTFLSHIYAFHSVQVLFPAPPKSSNFDTKLEFFVA